jgi:predicted transcriptional regulator
MSTQITITLPDEVYQRIERFARLANRDVASILADTIQHSIPLIRADVLDLKPVSDLSDQQVLALTELQMEPDQDARLSELLDRQQAGILVENEQLELQNLMQIYQEGLLRKATALSEAVKRGLMEPLSQ